MLFLSLKNITEFIQMKIKLNLHSAIATVLGLLTSVATALVVIDFDTFDFKKTNDLFKLFVVVMPAIGGYVSKIKSNGKTENDTNN